MAGVAKWEEHGGEGNSRRIVLCGTTTYQNCDLQSFHIFHESLAVLTVHSSEKKVFGLLNPLEKCHKICYVSV